jgi:hypothetical protein
MKRSKSATLEREGVNPEDGAWQGNNRKEEMV